MPLPFTEFRLIYPPHPAMTLKPGDLRPLRGYIAQYKYDDWRVLLYFFPDGSVRLFNRKKHELPLYRPPVALVEELKDLHLARGKFHVLDGGLLHYRTARVKNTIVLWDVLVHSGRYLVGENYRDRYKRLEKICRHPKTRIKLDKVSIGLRISPHIWLAPILTGEFAANFKKTAQLPELEGLVLKNLGAPLVPAEKMENNDPGQIRVRKPSANYTF